MNTKNLVIRLLAGTVLASSAMAQSIWTGSIDNNFNTAGNWSPSGVPGDTSVIEINTGTSIFNGSDSSLLRRATTTIDGGTLVLNNVRFRNAENGPATFNMVTGALIQNDATYFMVGRNNAGTFNQSGGTVDLTIGRGFFLTDGGGTAGTYNLTGGTLDVKLNQYSGDVLTGSLFNAWVGRGGNSDLMNVDGGTFNLDVTGPAGADRNFLVARNATFRVDSGTVDMQGLLSFTVGQARVANTTSNMLINGGNTTLAVTEALIIGGGVSGSLIMNGGTLAVNTHNGLGGELRLGDVSISDTVETGGKSATTDASVLLNGGTIQIAGDLVLGVDANNTSSFIMEDGELFANDIFVGLGDVSFAFNGGQIQLNGDRTDLISESWFTGAAGTFAVYDAVNDFTLIAIPEPGTLVLLVAALGFFAWHRRSKTRH